jgi:hypothetical protein
VNTGEVCLRVAHVLEHVPVKIVRGFECCLAFEKADDIDRLRVAAKLTDGEVLSWLD